MKAKQSSVVAHEFDYNGELVVLKVRTGFTTDEYNAQMKKIRAGVQDRQNAAMAEMLIQDWNLEDDNGKVIPLHRDDIHAAVPMILLARVIREATTVIQTGGIGKNN